MIPEEVAIWFYKYLKKGDDVTLRIVASNRRETKVLDMRVKEK